MTNELAETPDVLGLDPSKSYETPEAPKIPRVDEKGYNDLEFGSKYLPPEGDKVLTKYYRPKTAEDHAKIPEGAEYINPETGKPIAKKKSEPLNFSTQTLFNMAVNDKERENALNHGYPGKVRKNKYTGDLEVAEEGGVIRRPKGFTEGGAMAGVASEAGPVGGAVLGAIGGSRGGFGGTYLGAAGGSALGTGLNDVILGLFGVRDRTVTEDFAATGKAALSAISGAGVGKGIAAISPLIGKAVASGGGSALGSFLGADKQSLDQALKLRDKGVLVGPSTWAMELPALINIAEVYDPVMRTQNVLEQSATKHMEDTTRQILKDAGVDSDKYVINPTAAVPVKETGEALRARAADELAVADQRLNTAIEAKKMEVRVEHGKGALGADPVALEQTARESRQAAQKLINLGFEDLQKGVDQALEAVGAGHNSGELWWTVGEKITQFREAIMARAKIMYGQADAMAGTHLPDASGLPDLAQDFLNQLPEGFERNWPNVVKQIRDMAGVPELDKAGNPTGKWAKEPVNPTFGQLHNLRSLLRSNYNRLELSPDIKEGTFKYFANRVDEVLKNPGAVPELQDAARMLREADTFYRENIGPLNDKRIQAVMDGLRSGMPADPKVLFDLLLKEGRTELADKMKEIVGKNVWAGVASADVQEMLDMSKTLVPGHIDGQKFAAQVLSRHQRNMLEVVHGKEVSEKLLKQAQAVAALEGKLELPVRPGDTLTDVINRARQAAAAAVEQGKKDPLATLEKEMKRIEAEAQKGRTQAIAKDPLNFLYDPTVGAIESAETILKNEDLVLAVAGRYGKDSPEFKMLQQVRLQQILRDTMDPGARLRTISPEVQQVLFPGVTEEQILTLAKEMDFLRSGRAATGGTGQSIAAQSRVNNPWSGVHIPGVSPISKALGINALARKGLTQYYKFVLETLNRPGLMRYIQKGMEGDPTAQAMTRAQLQQIMRRGSAIGAGVGEAVEQRPQQ